MYEIIIGEISEMRKIDWKNLSVGPEEVLEKVLEDKDFYDASGGGVTISGGECMLQADSVASLAKRLKDMDVSVLIDTAGCVSYEQFEKINSYVDGYLFDYKTASKEKYREVIGGDIDKVHENINRLIKEGKEVRIRIPLIPEFNTAPEDVSSMCEVLKNLGVKEVDLLPFHRMGSSKYEALGMEYAYRDVELLTVEQIETIKQQFALYFKTKVEH